MFTTGESFWSKGLSEFVVESQGNIFHLRERNGNVWTHKRSFVAEEYRGLFSIDMTFSVQEFDSGYLDAFLIISAESDYLTRQQVKEAFMVVINPQAETPYTYDDEFGVTRTLESDDPITSTLYLGDLQPYCYFDTTLPFECTEDEAGERDHLQDISNAFCSICSNLGIKDITMIREGINHLKEVVTLRDNIFKSYQQANLH